MKKRLIIIASLVFSSLILFTGFETNNSEGTKQVNSINEFQENQDTTQSSDKGIGPVKEVKLGSIDKNLVDKGSSIYDDKCSLCHDIDDVNLAPPLKGLTKALSPVFIMNYLMNTTEMQKKDPYVKKLIKEWKNVPIMKDQHLKEKDARAVLEFLRSLDK